MFAAALYRDVLRMFNKMYYRGFFVPGYVR